MKVLAVAGENIILQATKEEIEQFCDGEIAEGKNIEVSKMYDSIVNVSMMGTDATDIATQLRDMADNVQHLAMLGTQVRA